LHSAVLSPSSVVTVTIAVPVVFAVTIADPVDFSEEVPLTTATSESLDFHVTFLLVAFRGL